MRAVPAGRGGAAAAPADAGTALPNSATSRTDAMACQSRPALPMVRMQLLLSRRIGDGGGRVDTVRCPIPAAGEPGIAAALVGSLRGGVAICKPVRPQAIRLTIGSGGLHRPGYENPSRGAGPAASIRLDRLWRTKPPLPSAPCLRTSPQEPSLLT